MDLCNKYASEPQKMIVFEPVQAAIWHCVNHHAYSNAIFLAERLYAEVPTDEALFLLATCYYRAGQTSMAYSILSRKKPQGAKGRYLLAKCCVDLLKIPEAELILKGDVFLRNTDINEEEIMAEFGETSCFVLQLLGTCAVKTQRLDVAIKCFEKSLKLNPFLWDSFEQICNLGGSIEPDEVFSLSKIDNFMCCHGVNPVVSLVNQEYNRHTQLNNMDSPMKKSPVQMQRTAYNGTCAVRLFVTPEESASITPNSLGIANLSSSIKPRKTRFRSMLSPIQLPSFGLLPFNRDAKTPTEALAILSPEIIHRPSRRVLMKETPLQQTVFSQSGNTDSASPPRPSVRRSTRLFSNNASVKENNKSPKHGKFASPKSPSRKSKRGAAAKTLPSYNEIVANNEKNKAHSADVSVDKLSGQAVQIQKDSAEGLMTLFRDIGAAILHMSKFECKKAIEGLSSLSPAHYNTGWVQGMIGKAYFELPDYHNAVTHFRRLRELDPERVALTEVFSSALWFLQREVELSALSQHLVTHARHSPQTWCVAANCFSLHKEHETAIKFLHRAVQMNPWFGYAYTLLGHEYLATEELDKAVTCFRDAIRISSRDYSAYFGLGSVYSKQEKFSQAQVHYSLAERINPKNVTILCHLGVVLNAQQKTEAALSWFEKALELDPRNPLCKFQRANVFFTLGRNSEALAELEELRHIVPKESSVYYLMGKIHKKLGDTDKALMHFSWAMDLDPKGVHAQIKESIDPSAPRAGDTEESGAEQEIADLDGGEQNASDESY